MGPEASARPTRAEAPCSAEPILDQPPEDGLALYVHLPFCASKCSYCDFNSWAVPSPDFTRHVDAILAEARRRAAACSPTSVFLGGGTPSLLPPEALIRLLDGLDDICGFRASSLETTMEANPESFTEETATAAREGGVDRLSLGVQSFRDEVLAAYDRVHSHDQSLRAFSTARDAGFRRINLDLIHSFPGQSLEDWSDDLRLAHELGPEHLSCYELSYEPGTALTRRVEVGRAQAADPSRAAQFFLETRRRNEDAGYRAYEVSAFAREGERCRHNLSYWRSLEYIGLGAGASSWLGGERRRNLERPEVYEAAALSGKETGKEMERPSPEQQLFDALMMGLRLPEEGVSIPRVVRQCGIDPLRHLAQALAKPLAEGLLETTEVGGEMRLRVTAEGLLWLDDILVELLPD